MLFTIDSYECYGYIRYFNLHFGAWHSHSKSTMWDVRTLEHRACHYVSPSHLARCQMVVNLEKQKKYINKNNLLLNEVYAYTRWVPLCYVEQFFLNQTFLLSSGIDTKNSLKSVQSFRRSLSHTNRRFIYLKLSDI